MSEMVRIPPRQSGVVVSAIPSSSSPSMPGLSSGSTSPSISSVDTASSLGVRGTTLQLLEDHGMAPVITAMSGAAAGDGAALSRASSSSWGTTAPSASSDAVSLVVSVPDQNGSRMYGCLFHMLDCHHSFDDSAQWRTHILSHFRTHPPPSSARCPLCPDTKFVDGDSDSSSIPVKGERTNESVQKDNTVPDAARASPEQPSAWDRMLNHVAADHYQHGHTLAGSRVDFELMRYLYGLRIISDAQFKAMQLAPAPSSPAYHRSQDGVRASIGSSDEPYCAPYSRRREERMRGSQRGVSCCLISDV